MKILYVAHERKLGGATLSLLALIDKIKEKGHDVIVIVPTKKCPLANELRKREVTYIPVFLPWIQMPKYWNFVIKLCFRIFYMMEPLQICYIYHKVKKERISLVHSNSSVIDFGVRLAKKLKCGHVWHIREFGDEDYRLEYLKDKKNVWNDMNCNSDKIIFISQNLYEYFAPYTDKEKGIIIYNGISEKYVIKREYEEKKKVVFLISGNLNRNKQQMLVLQAAKELLKTTDAFEVWIAGSATSMIDSQEYKKELEKFVEENLTGTVKMLGRIENMNEIRKEADVEIVASNREAFGRVTIEAMFAGMPVIGADSGANPELIRNGRNGVLFSNGDENDLAEKMQYFIKNRECIETMGKEAALFAMNSFTAKKNADAIEELYYDILK